MSAHLTPARRYGSLTIDETSIMLTIQTPSRPLRFATGLVHWMAHRIGAVDSAFSVRA